MNREELISKLIELPFEVTSKNKSVDSYFIDIGYLDLSIAITEDEMLLEVKKRPQLIQEWQAWSEDKRTSGWYIRPLDDIYEIGYIDINGVLKYSERVEDKYSAFSKYISNEIKDMKSSITYN